MSVIESVEARRDEFRLTYDDGSILDIGKAYLPPEYSNPGFFLRPSEENPDGEDSLGTEAEAAFRFAAECLAAEKAALRLVARAEQCGEGLRRKLERKRHPAGPVRAVIDRLAALNLINDERYARLWLKYRVRHGGKGPRTLAAQVQAKGIGRKTAAAALEAVLNPEAEAALLEKCAAKAAASREKDGLRYLLKAEGFSQAAIDGYFETASLP